MLPWLQELVQTYTHMAKAYIEELEMWADVDYYEDNVIKVQLPFTQVMHLYKDTKMGMTANRNDKMCDSDPRIETQSQETQVLFKP